MDSLKSLKELYGDIEGLITARIDEFDTVKQHADNKKITKELVFCLMTPQSKAKVCAAVTDNIFYKDAVFNMSEQELSDAINNVRFKNNKAKYIKEALNKFKNINIKEKISGFDSAYSAREWLVSNIKGYGYKEASHFLRNTGFGYNLAILDRHILKNLVIFGIIPDIPKSISPIKYQKIEENMQKFSKQINIPMHHLDFLLWYKETNEVFK